MDEPARHTPSQIEFGSSPLPRSFFDRDTVTVARELLGMLLVRATHRGWQVGRIVETEAYLSTHDSACHAARGRTRKNASMFGRPGTAYVYAIHARWCCNVVTEPRGTPAAVLIRAVEPLAGLAAMEERRKTNRLLDLARGPARLCEAFAIDRRLDGWDLCRGHRLWLTTPLPQLPSPANPSSPALLPPLPPGSIRCSPRIGVTSAQDLPLRFFLASSPFVSGSRTVPPRENGGARSAN